MQNVSQKLQNLLFDGAYARPKFQAGDGRSSVWRDGSGVKNTYYSCRRYKVGVPAPPWSFTATYDSNSRCTHVHVGKHSHSQTKQNKSTKRLRSPGLSQTSKPSRACLEILAGECGCRRPLTEHLPSSVWGRSSSSIEHSASGEPNTEWQGRGHQSTQPDQLNQP